MSVLDSDEFRRYAAGGGATFGAATKTRLRGWLRDMQIGRLRSVLSGLSDDQLADIGVGRAEIAAYARRIVTDDR